MLDVQGLLNEAEGSPVGIVNPGAEGSVLLICEHASRTLPSSLGTLGLSEEALVSHIAWDPGALAVAQVLSGLLDATLIHQRFSRLAYDCNRPPEAPGAMPETSEIYTIPGNSELSQPDRDLRTHGLYLPFHAAIDACIAERQARGQGTVLVTMHSFTPIYMGKPRAVEVGILHDSDSRLADLMLENAKPGPVVRRNEPYGPADGVTHTLIKHGLSRGLPNVMIEVRNDLIDAPESQMAMAQYLADAIKRSLPQL